MSGIFACRLSFTNDTVDDSFAPKDTKPKPVPHSPEAGPKRQKHVQLFQMRHKVGKGFYLVPVNQNASD